MLTQYSYSHIQNLQRIGGLQCRAYTVTKQCLAARVSYKACLVECAFSRNGIYQRYIGYNRLTLNSPRIENESFCLVGLDCHVLSLWCAVLACAL